VAEAVGLDEVRPHQVDLDFAGMSRVVGHHSSQVCKCPLCAVLDHLAGALGSDVPRTGAPESLLHGDSGESVAEELAALAADGVVRGVSIGFRAQKYAFKDDGGIDFMEIDIYELSTVSVPALPQAIITQVKSMDDRRLPADVVRLIRRADAGGSVKLIHANSNKGAVRLLK